MLQQFLAAVQKKSGVPGISAAIIADGAELSASAGLSSLRTQEPMQSQTRLGVACVMKLLVSVAAARRVVDGHLNLDDPVRNYIPELGGCECGDSVRLRDLLLHAGGYVADGLEPTLDWPDFVQGLRRARMLFEPGSVFSYEHTDTVLAGRILSALDARDVSDVVRHEVLGPLNIEAGTFEDRADSAHTCDLHDFDPVTQRFVPLEQPPPSAPMQDYWGAAISPLTMSMSALARVGAQFFRNGDKASVAALDGRVRELMLQPGIRIPPMARSDAHARVPEDFTLGCYRYADGSFSVQGSSPGHTVQLVFNPERNISIAMGMNSMQPAVRDFVVSSLLSALKISAPTPHGVPFDMDLDDLAGEYESRLTQPRATVHVKGRSIVWELPSSTAADALRIEGQVTPDGVLHAETPLLSAGFFRDRRTGAPCMMVGHCAYRRVRE